MRDMNNKFAWISLAWILMLMLILLSLALPVMAAPEAQETSTPTSTPEVGYKQQLSSGNWIQVERSFSFGEIAIAVSVMILTMAVVLYIIWDIISHYIY